MSIWFFLWLVLSIGLLGFTAWSIYVIQQQKKAWKAYAKKYKLRYKANQMLESPNINGVLEGYTLGILVGQHNSEDARRSRRLSAIEVTLNGTLPADGALASADMVAVVQDLGLQTEVKPKHPDWKDSYIAATNKKAVMDSYLTRERLDKLTELMAIKNAAVILIFREDIMLLRLDTPDPLDKPQKIDRLVKKMIEAAKVLDYSGELPDDIKAADEPKDKPEEPPKESDESAD